MTICRRNDGRLQMRRAQPGKLTREAEQAFLAALSATCNIRLAAAAVGSVEGAFYRRQRKDPGFAREMRMALRQGWEALEGALLEAGLPGSHEHDDWRHNEPPAVPPMTVSQALQLLYLHQKIRLNAVEPRPIRRRRGEPDTVYYERMAQLAEARLQREREKFEVAEVLRWERGEPARTLAGAAVRRELGLGDAEDPSTAFGGPPPSAGIPPACSQRSLEAGSAPENRGRMGLPDLAQVTGWSKADPSKTPHHPERALFGGWRIEDMEARLRRGR